MTFPLTFLFSDLENSTPLWEQFPNEMQPAAARHDALMRGVIEQHRGWVVKTTGDGFHAAFESPAEGVAAALAGQQAISAEPWPNATGPLKVRMGLHTGESQEREGDYYGSNVNLAARIMGLGHGGQILLSEATATLIKSRPPQGCTLSDLGEHRLKGIAVPSRIFQLCHPDLVATFPPLKSLAAFKHNLHRQVSSFIGREKELADVKRLLKDTHLLTLLGPGGTGKTRLMLQAAEEIIEDYPDGVWLVELAPLTDPQLIPERVAAALTVQQQPGRELFDTLADFLRRKELLLLLDNVEHLVRESAMFAERLLEQCPKLKILVTGREALFIDGETTLQIPSLSLPRETQTREEIAKSEGVQLFLERARGIRPDFVLTEQNAAPIAEIVRRLDGIPLALELAAARLRMLTAEQIAARLNDRFRLLTSGRRTALPRQQTLQALIDWSWNLLDEQERVLLCRLSVFSSGWALEAAQAVAGFDPLDEFAVFDALEQLINKSLVAVQHPDGREARYGMLESIRQYARDRLGEAGERKALSDRHAEYFIAFGERVSHAMQGRDMVVWLERLLPEADNAKATREWTLQARLDLALRMAGVSPLLTRYWFFSSENINWLEQVIAQARSHLVAETDPEFRRGLAKAVISLGTATMFAGDFERGRQILEGGIELARETGLVEPRVLGQNMLLISLFQVGDLETAKDVAEESLVLSKQHGLDFWYLMTLGYLVPILVSQGEDEQADLDAIESIRLALILDNPWLNAMISLQLARLEGRREHWDQAEQYAAKAVDLFEAVRDRDLTLAARSELAHMRRMMGDLVGAEQVYRQTIVAFQEREHIPAVAHQLECLGMIAARRGEDSRAVKLLGAAQAIRAAIQRRRLPNEQHEFQQTLSLLSEALGEARRDEMMAAGAQMSMDEAVAFALNQSEGKL